MSSVGLNFGSGTSGQGFDVTSTVNQIVSNFQSVETPWKTALASLQNRDTALSSLGKQISTLSSDLQNLTDFQGTLSSKIGSSSDTSVLVLTSAGATAARSTHTVVVQNLAQTSSAATDAVAASDVLTGGITFKVGNGEWQTVSVGDNATATTISGLSAAINAAGLNVQASVLTNADGTQRLTLVSRVSGAAGQIKIADSSNNPDNPTTLADSTTAHTKASLSLAVVQNGLDAFLKVDGISVSSASNKVSNAIPGVTFELLSTGNAGSGPESIQVIIDNDTSTIESAINTFVSDFNATIKAINEQEGKDPSGSAEPLYGTAILARLQQGLLSAVSSSLGTGTINSLISLGISASATADGTLTLNADTLSSALNSHFDDVVSFFQDPGKFGSTFAGILHGLSNNAGADGAISLALKEVSRQEDTLNDNISKQEALIATQRETLTAELNMANQILQAIPQLIQQVDQMYSAITGYNSKSR
jgi:flagellar hook-associated protein 2